MWGGGDGGDGGGGRSKRCRLLKKSNKLPRKSSFFCGLIWQTIPEAVGSAVVLVEAPERRPERRPDICHPASPSEAASSLSASFVAFN